MRNPILEGSVQDGHHGMEDSKRRSPAHIVFGMTAALMTIVIVVAGIDAFRGGQQTISNVPSSLMIVDDIPSSLTVADNNQPVPLGLALSGGGWRAQAASVGFYKALSDLDISAVACVSGASWFAVMYSLDEKYHNAVNTLDPAQVTTDFLQSYLSSNASCQGTQINNNIDAVYTDLYNLNTFSNISVPSTCEDTYPNNWQLLIEGMMQAYSNSSAITDAALPAFLSDFDLIVGSTLATEGTMDNPDTATVTVQGVRTVVNPISYVISNTGAAYDPCLPDDFSTVQVRSSSGALGELVNGLVAVPSAGKLASMSSAAAGLIGSPSIMSQICEETQGDCALPVISSEGLQDLAVCSGAAATGCAFPSTRFLDGGYTDDSGITHLVSHMQAKFPAAETLRVVALDNNQYTNWVAQALPGTVTSELKYLFSGTSQCCSEGCDEANVTEMCRSSHGFYVPSNTIFTNTWDATEAIPGTKISSDSDMTYSLMNLTTQANPTFGVLAGTTVQLLVININQPTIKTFFAAGSTNTVEQYAAVSSDTYNAMESLMGLEATKAFFAEQ